MKKGQFIVFDGIDGSGKTTQIRLLAEHLKNQGYDVVQSKEPTNGKYGSVLRSSAEKGRLPFEEELEYFLKDREEHIQNLIIPSLEEGKIVLVDRYYYSTIAYQGVRCGDVNFILNKVLQRNFLIPDITFIFDLPVSSALERIIISRGGIPNEFEKAEILEAVRNVFLEFEKCMKEIRVIDCRISIEEIYNVIHNQLPNILNP